MTATDPAQILFTLGIIDSPASGSTLPNAPVTFHWNAVAGADQYWLDIGSTVGGSDLWRGAFTATSQLVTSLPCDGRTINAQLFTHLNGAWTSPQRYTYTAPAGCYAVLTTPTPGTVLTSSNVTFGWSAANGADQYWLDIGSTLGGSDLWRGALTMTSQSITGLPCDGRTINVQLYTHANGAWTSPLRYTYTAPGCVPTLITPTPGTALSSTTVTFGWNTVAGADQYWLDIGSTVGGSDLWRGALTATSQLVTGLPCDGRTINAQLFTHVNGAWSSPRRFTYTASTGCFTVLTSPTPNTTLSSTTVTFGWSSATGADQYWLDVGSSLGTGDIWRGALTATSQLVTGIPCDGRTVYAQLYTHRDGAWLSPLRYTYTAPTGCYAIITSPTPGTTLTSTTVAFTWSAANGADQYWLDVGTALGVGDIWRGSLTGTSQVATGVPCNGGTLYVQLYTHSNSNWQALQRYTYTAPSGCFAPLAQILTPTPSTALPATSVTFTWSAGMGADQYWLDVGTSLASGDLSAGSTAATSKTVSGLPCDGRMLYVQLYTHSNSNWQAPQRYTYTAPTGCTAEIILPIASSILPGATVTFTWTAAVGASQYWLDVGTKVGTGDISAGSLTSTSRTVAGIPCDGRTIYVQLYTSFAGVWQAPQRYTYAASNSCAAAPQP
jgi:hypothetical protein